MEQQASKPLFDASKPIVVPILSGGEKRCEVRFPTDEEWCYWARAQRTIRHFLGRGKSQSVDVDLPKVNAELFKKIRTDKDGPEFDDAEAGMVIGRVERCQVADIQREGVNYRIEMKVPGAKVTHVLRMPTAKEMQEHDGASTSVVWPPGAPSRRGRSWSRAARSTTSCTSRTRAMPPTSPSSTSLRRCPRSLRNWQSRQMTTRNSDARLAGGAGLAFSDPLCVPPRLGLR